MQSIALIIFIITYTGIIFTRLPRINIDRPSAAFFGAIAMVLFNVLTLEEAVQAIDYNTIALLLGMMIIISTLQLDGFFSLIATKTITYSKDRLRLMIIIVFITGIASAFFVNDAVVLLFTPVIITICSSSGLNPLPYLIAEILASNAGSVMTITGNPQNMLIGISSGISYGKFLIQLLPVTVLSLIIIVFVIKLIYKTEFNNKSPIKHNGQQKDYHYKSMRFSVPIFLGVIILFFFSNKLNLSIPLIALTGGALVLIFGKIKPSSIIRAVDWVLLLFFASLFIVVRGIEKAGLLEGLINSSQLTADLKGIGALHLISLIFSQVVSNVPYTMLILPVMKSINSELLWLTLASASTLAGNATIIGAMANLIVIESAEKHKIKIRFFEFLKTGLLATLLSFIISILLLWMQSLYF